MRDRKRHTARCTDCPGTRGGVGMGGEGEEGREGYPALARREGGGWKGRKGGKEGYLYPVEGGEGRGTLPCSGGEKEREGRIPLPCSWENGEGEGGVPLTCPGGGVRGEEEGFPCHVSGTPPHCGLKNKLKTLPSRTRAVIRTGQNRWQKTLV